ncbi:hypothetical protein GCL60_11775 [Silvanigrella paludirubra]|uniref:histidine kinase n=1 Tax=Silvanigrella paludirubra TaxID=2499159 RepID=A0A6N6VT23_9BACT|nr:HAMP domain-containing sensor histidine kinase [Silvanigrella paludirubra]KAB8037846.1 hypothetical protein GCL60_11775 [Silvanigrella paludirubra]
MESSLEIKRSFKNLSFKNSIFILAFSIFIITFLVYSLATFFIVKHSLDTSFKKNIIFSQNLFTDSIRNDILTGLYSELFRKCKLFFDSGRLESLQVIDSSGNVICSFENSILHDIGFIKTNIYFDENKSQIASTITTNFSYASIKEVLVNSIYIIIFIVIFISIILAFFVNIMSKYFGEPVQNISNILQNFSIEDIAKGMLPIRTSFIEIEKLNLNVSKMAENILYSQKQLVQKTESEAIAKVASQVVHDIRSPLSVLNIYLKKISTLPEEERVFIRNATERIDDIANNLIHKLNKKANNNLISKEIISLLVEKIVSEKRVQFSNKNIKFITQIDSNSFLANSEVNSTQFQSVISNLINNSVESISNSGNIIISLLSNEFFIELKIIDDGCGIPDEILQKVIIGGISTKAKGTGIGLSSSIKFIKSWGGDLKISSKINEGTIIEINLKTSELPHWIPKKIQIQKNSSLLILDDDQSIHDVMNHKLNSIINSNDKINILHFKSPEKLIDFYENFHKNQSDKIYFFLDNELIGYNLTGIDIICKFNLKDNSVLITSRYDEDSVQEKCKRLGIKLFPKGIAYYLPIEII